MVDLDPFDIFGILLGAFAIVGFLVVVIWMPLQIRKEQRELEEQRLKPIHTQLKGTTEVSDIGAPRQQLIQTLSPETAITLKKKSESGYGVNVCLENGEPIGTLPSKLGKTIARELELGHQIDARISDVTTGTEESREYSVKLVLQRHPGKK